MTAPNSSWTSAGAGRADGQSPERRVRAGELRQAIATHHIEVYYQPVVKMLGGQVASVEALARWTDPVRGPISPEEFISLAEDFDLIANLTADVVSQVAADSRTWSAAGRHLPCAINLSIRVLTDPDTTDRLVSQLCDLAGAVTVEVTESVMANPAAIAVLQRLADAGIPCAIDDFGTGYSSLGALKNLPATTLKIDRSFIKDIERDPRDFAMVRAVVDLATTLGLDVIAEGMETIGAALRARDAGVASAQGFYFARPMPAAQLASWLACPPCHVTLFGTTAQSGQDDSAVVGSTEPKLPTELDLAADQPSMQVLLDSTRSLLRVESPEQAVGVLLRAVLDLGGTTVPAVRAPAHAIPIDISLGEADPMLPLAALGTAVRRTLERALPGLVEDARTAANRARRLSRLADQVDIDPLTGLGNRRGLTRVRRLHNADAIAIIDLDHFKLINDTYGHGDGDRMLVAFSRAMRQHLRSTDLVFRLGGEEFLLIMPTTTPEGAMITLAHLREKWGSARPRPVTFSAGVAGVVDSDLSAAIIAADAALYQAKERGRDRFECAPNASTGTLQRHEASPS